MNFTQSESERLVFEKIAREFEQKGYEFIQAEQALIPKEKWRYVPDFIAKKGNQYIAIEIKSRRTRSIERSLEMLRELIEQDKNWQFRVFYAEEEIDTASISKPDSEMIRSTIREVRNAYVGGFHNAAFLLAWAVFEASARNTHSRIFSKPQTPGRIITVLAERGEIAPSEADKLRDLAQIRNRLIHGGLGSDIEKSDIEFILRVVEKGF